MSRPNDYATFTISQSMVPVAPVGVEPNTLRIENDAPDAMVFMLTLLLFAVCAAAP